MRPMRIDEKSMTKERSNAAVVSSSDEDDRAGRMSLQIEREVGRKRVTCWRAFGACSMPKSSGCEPSIGALLKIGQASVFEAMPDLGLPAAVEAFDSVLKTRFAWRSKHGSDAEQQASSYDLTDGVGVLMRPLKNERVVELCVRRKPRLLPTTGEQRDNAGCVHRGPRPAGDKTSVNGDAGEDTQLRSPSENQTFNGVEGIEFATARCNLGKVPADRRRRSTDAPSCIENPSPLEDATDRASRGNRSHPLLDHRQPDRIRAELAQIALGQFTAQPQNLFFSGHARSIHRLWRACRSIGPVDSIKPCVGSASDPSPYSLETDAKLAGNLAQGVPSANSVHHRPALLLDGVLCSRAFSLFRSAYQPVQAAHETGLWNLTGYGKPAKTAAFPQPLENAPHSTARVSHSSHSPC